VPEGIGRMDGLTGESEAWFRVDERCREQLVIIEKRLGGTDICCSAKWERAWCVFPSSRSVG